MWVEVAFSKDKLYMAYCCILYREPNYYNLYELDRDDPFSDVRNDIHKDWKSSSD